MDNVLLQLKVDLARAETQRQLIQDDSVRKTLALHEANLDLKQQNKMLRCVFFWKAGRLAVLKLVCSTRRVDLPGL